MAVSLRDRYGSAKEVAGSTAANKASLAKKGQNNPFYGKHWKLVDGKRVYY